MNANESKSESDKRKQLNKEESDFKSKIEAVVFLQLITKVIY